MIIDGQTTQSPIYEEQGGKVLHMDSGARWEINGVPTGLSANWNITPGAANVCNVGLQIRDLAGNNCSTVFVLSVWLSDSPTGAGFAAHVPSGGITATGFNGGVLVYSKVTKIATEAFTGVGAFLGLNITDTAKTGYYVCTVIPSTGLVAVSPQLIAANYG